MIQPPRAKRAAERVLVSILVVYKEVFSGNISDIYYSNKGGGGVLFEIGRVPGGKIKVVP